MKLNVAEIVPSRLEAVGVAFTTLVMLLLGNGHDLLARYGLIRSTQVVHTQLTQGLGTGLQRLDAFTFTQTAVNFVVWGMVGLVAFSIFQAIVSTSKQLRYERSLSSNQYVHPANFSRQRYWRRVVTGSLISFLLLITFVVAAGFYVLRLLPYAVHRAGSLRLAPTVGHVADLVVGVALLFLGTYVLYGLLKAVRWQHHVSAV